MARPKILVAAPAQPALHRGDAATALGPLVEYRPELVAWDEAARAAAILDASPDALIVGRSGIDARSLARWCGQATSQRLLVQTDATSGRPPVRTSELDIQTVPGTGEASVTYPALAAAERWLARRLARERWARMDARSPLAVAGAGADALEGRDIALVGAGVVNLVTGLALCERGARVAIYDARPDPRGACARQRLGCTHGGGNARVYCATESGSSHARIARCGDGVATGPGVQRTISADGWLLTPFERLSEGERAWLERFVRVPSWRAQVFAEDVHAVNAASGVAWMRMRQEYPHLFEDVGFLDRVVCVYTERDTLEEERAWHHRMGVLRATMNARELAARHPALGEAVARDALVGGLEIEGFSLRVHDFCARVMAHLEARGATCHWEREIAGLARDEHGSIAGLVVDDRTVRAHHYVISPGAYGQHLLRSTRSADKVHGVLGLWIFLPDPRPMPGVSFKLRREGLVGADANIIPATDARGRPGLLVGAGYGFVGADPRLQARHATSPEMAVLLDALHTTARRFLPHAYERAFDAGDADALAGAITGEGRSCVRPFTATGLGIFEVMAATDGGRLIVTAGHDTGGFSQAPAVAHAVVDTLSSRDCHDMAALFDPERGLERA